MGVQHLLQAWWPSIDTSPTAQVDEEIREELEFHLTMRTVDNLREGMTADAAWSDAERRFGDFEHTRRACRRITLGPRIMFARIQTVLLLVLSAAVVFLGVRLSNVQMANRQEIKRLKQQFVELHAPKMPFVHWSSTPPTTPPDGNPTVELPQGWAAADDLMSQPWSDWTPITDELLPLNIEESTHAMASR